jgi:hypothetical protein
MDRWQLASEMTDSNYAYGFRENIQMLKKTENDRPPSNLGDGMPASGEPRALQRVPARFGGRHGETYLSG